MIKTNQKYAWESKLKMALSNALAEKLDRRQRIYPGKIQLVPEPVSVLKKPIAF